MSSSKVTVDYLKRIQDRIIGLLPGMEEEDKLPETALEAAIAMPSKGTKWTSDDIRFPNTSMAQNCWTSLNEWQLCVDKLGKTAPECFQRYRDFNTLCPAHWMESFQEHAEDGHYMGVKPVFSVDDEE